ncbi:MAG: PKD domain-containing protein [Chloroflexota bacterium]
MNRRYIPLLTAGIVGLILLLTLIQWARADRQPLVLREAERPFSTGFGYVGFSSSDDMAIFNLETGEALPEIDLLPEGNYPYDVTLNPDESELWIVGASGDGAIVIDTATNSISHHVVAVGDYPVDVMFSKYNDYAFIANRDTETIAVMDTATYALSTTFTISSALATAPDPGKMALNACTGDIYIVDWYDANLFVIDPLTGATVDEMALGGSLWDLVLSPDASTLFVTDRGQDRVHVIDTATFTEITSVPTGDDPWGIDITPDGSLLFVANEDSHNVTVIDAVNNTVVTTIAMPDLSADPRDLDISSDGAYAYVPSGDLFGPDAVYVIDTAVLSVTGVITFSNAIPGVTANPNALAVAPELNNLDPVASFTATTPVAVGTPIQFTDTSSNQPTNWLWDFGDGLGNSAVQNPLYNYLNAGTYTVTLTVGNACGSTQFQLPVEVLGEPPVLNIAKTGPATAVSGALITYTLTLTNDSATPAANVVITDRLPIGASYVSGGTLVGDEVQWQVSNLGGGTTVSVQFTVTATETITNSAYGAVAAGGYAAQGSQAVVTVIEAINEMRYVYLPLLQRP